MGMDVGVPRSIPRSFKRILPYPKKAQAKHQDGISVTIYNTRCALPIVVWAPTHLANDASATRSGTSQGEALAFNSYVDMANKEHLHPGDRALMSGTLQQHTIALENGATTIISHFYVTSLEVLSRSKRTSMTVYEKEKTRKQCSIEISSEGCIFRSPTVVKMC